MEKFKVKDIRDYVRLGIASDLTNLSSAEMHEFLKVHDVEKIGYSTGVYGINGGLMKDRGTGELYAITARNAALLTAF